MKSNYRSFSSDVTAAILVYQNNEMAAILVYGTGISSFLFKYFVLFHHPTGATDHVSENDLLLYFYNYKFYNFRMPRFTFRQPRSQGFSVRTRRDTRKPWSGPRGLGRSRDDKKWQYLTATRQGVARYSLMKYTSLRNK